MAQSSKGRKADTLEKHALERVTAFMEASLPYVDDEALNRSEEKRLVLACFVFGAAHHFILRGRSPSENKKDTARAQVHAVTMGVLQRLFDWSWEDCAYVAQLVIDATEYPDMRELMHEAMEACRLFEERDQRASRVLAETLESIGSGGDELN